MQSEKEIQEMKEKMKRLILSNYEKIAELPKGAVQRKIIRERECAYLVWREGGEIKSEFLGPWQSALRLEMEEKIRSRRELYREIRIYETEIRILGSHIWSKKELKMKE